MTSYSFHRKYQVCREIGRGRSGRVYLCRSRLTNECFAAKSILKRDNYASEWKLLSLLSHPYIIKCHGVYEDDSCFYIVLDYCPMPDLLSMLNAKGGSMSEDEVRMLFKQLMNAIYHCHKHNVVHRDIKLDNILIDAGNGVKLADFGFAEVVLEGKTLKDMVGTFKYMAPEVLLEKGYDKKADVWSAGVVFYTMLTGFLPFNGESKEEIVEDFLKKKFAFPIISHFQSISPLAMDLLRKMLCVNPAKGLLQKKF